MKYFYAYLENKDNDVFDISLVESIISANHIYIDHNDNTQWERLTQELRYHDEIYCYELFFMAKDGNLLLDHLEYLKENTITLRLLDNTNVNIKQLIDVIKFYRNTQRKQCYEKQMEGIHKALEKKRNGVGAYGRPKIILPDDFEDNIKKIMKKEMKHEDYRKKLGFKRSTYFKFVKELKDTWKQKYL